MHSASLQAAILFPDHSKRECILADGFTDDLYVWVGHPTTIYGIQKGMGFDTHHPPTCLTKWLAQQKYSFRLALEEEGTLMTVLLWDTGTFLGNFCHPRYSYWGRVTACNCLTVPMLSCHPSIWSCMISCQWSALNQEWNTCMRCFRMIESVIRSSLLQVLHDCGLCRFTYSVL